MLQPHHKPRAKPFRLVALEPGEFEFHVSLVDALRKFAAPDCLWLHIGNGERREVVTGARLKRMGVRRGAADLLFIRPGAPPLFLEIKTSTGRLSETQRAFQELAERAGCEYRVCRSLDEALALLWRRGFLARKLV
jgi:VRR-NUC domain